MFLSKTIKSPLTRVKISGEFAKNSTKVKQLIKEAEIIINERKHIIKANHGYKKTVTGTIKYSRNKLNKITL